MLKQHKFWAIVMLVGAFMSFYTGHKMVAPKKIEAKRSED